MKEKWNAFTAKYGGVLSPVLFLLSVFLLDFSFRFIYSDAGMTSPWHHATNTFTLCWCVILTAAAVLLPGVWKKIWMGVFLFFSALLPLVHAIIYKINDSFLVFSDIAFAEDGMSFMELEYLAIPWQMYFFTALFTAVGVFSIVIAPKKQKYQPVKIGIVVLLAVVSFCAIGTERYAYTYRANRFNWLQTYDPNSIQAVYSDFTNANECLLFCGGPQYTIQSLTQGVSDQTAQEQLRAGLDEYYANHPKELKENDVTGLFEGKNVICILGESIDTWLLNEDVMPNLYRLQQNSIDFQNHYTPLFLTAGTFNTEFALNCGFYLPVSGTSARTYATNEYPQSLANVFKRNGYTANTYHQLDGSKYNRGVVHLQWGYDSYNGYDELEFEGSELLDTVLTQPSVYEKIVTHDKPFVSYVITYSGHGPYTEESERSKVIAPPHLERAKQVAQTTGALELTDNEETKMQYTRALAHAMMTDQMIGELIERMTADGHIDDTVILFFGDHYSKYMSDTGFVMRLKGVYDTYHLCHTPFFIYSHDLAQRLQERGKEGLLDGQKLSVNKVTASADMLPTLFNLMGFTYDPTYLAGSDAFSEYGGFVAFKDYTWIDNTSWWTPDPEQESQEVPEKTRMVMEFVSASWDTVKCNYFESWDK